VGSNAVVDWLISDNPDSSRQVGSSIVDYRLPFGYQEQGSLNLVLFKVVYIAPEDNESQFDASSQIMLINVPSALAFRQEEARQEIQLAMLRSSNEISTMEYVGEQFTVIRGEKVRLEVYETFGEYDVPYRMLFSEVFPGKSGNVMLVIAAPINLWDQQVVDQFVGSIR
jgi:hypothetical protein